MNDALARLLAWYLPTLSRDERFAIDIGAHHGRFAKTLLDQAGFETVVAYEASPATFAILRSNMADFSSDKFVAYNIGIGSSPGIAKLYSDTDSATASILPYISGYQNKGEIQEYDISINTLDHEIERLSQLPALVKIDTQGNDLSVLTGGHSLISAGKTIFQVEMIYVPLYKGQCRPAEIISKFSQYDYTLYSYGDIHIDANGRLAFCDAIFCPQQISPTNSNSFFCIDDIASYTKQITDLHRICEERLVAINVLDQEVKRLQLNSARPKGLSWLRRFHL